ncbi:MAG TPA: fumarylacetoacetate hydrolase family protein [Acidimicrobiales bacterium]|nr:fumarylacetoacetate hydrolase family protein [Acidimicrobiales bacterium]
MKFARFEARGKTSHGIVEDGKVTPIEGDLFGDRTPAGPAISLAGVRLLAPIVPGQMLAVALNYPSHLGEQPAAPRPELFVKANSSLSNPEDPIILPAGSERVDYEGEMVVVIGRRCKKVSVEDALSYVFGYTCGNDVSARDWQRSDMQWFRGKSTDTFGPIGPWIVDGLDPTNMTLSTRLNGEEVQRCKTGEMINSVAETISFASQVLTLNPGDVIFTGTSGRPRALKPGDVVEVEVEGIGVLRNPAVADPIAPTWKDRR